MKTKIIFLMPVIFLSLLNGRLLNAQIEFERNYTNSIYYTDLSEGEEKLFLMDVPFGECRIYNLDHSLYRTIKITLPANHWLYDIAHVTRYLFNDDESIELLYMAYEYFETETPYYQYMVGVVNESGASLLSVPQGTYYEVVEVEGKNKLLIWLYDNSIWPYFKGTNIYNLKPGGTSKIALSAALPYEPAYPNPASGQIVIPYDLPGERSQGTIQIISASGSVIDSFTVDNNFDELLLDVGGYSPGTYVVNIYSGNNEVLGTQKITVVK